MDDDRRDRDADQGDAAADREPDGGPPPPRPIEPGSPSEPVAPLNDPAEPQPSTPVRPADFWIRPSGALEPLAPPRGQLRVLSVVTRSIDLFLQRPVPFLLLALPTAVLSVLSSLIYLVGGPPTYPPTFAPGVTPTQPGLAAGLGILLGLVSLVVGIALNLAMTMAADDVRAGRTVDVWLRFRRGLGRSGWGLLSIIAELLAILGVLVGGALLVALLAVTRSIPLVVIGAIVLLVVVLWITVRWSLSMTAIALEPVGPLQALGRSLAVTRGNVWRLVAVFLVVGLFTMPFALGVALVSIVAIDAPIVLAVSSLSVFVTVPLFGILTTTVFADLTGRPEAPRARASGQTRLLFIAALTLVGVVGLSTSIPRVGEAWERLALQAIPAQSRGVIVAGLVRNPFDPCQPVPAAAGTLSPFAPIYLGGYFTKPIPQGDSGIVEMYVEGALVNAVQVSARDGAVSCWYDPDPLVDAPEGAWRVVVTYRDETIAEGEFTVR